MLPGVYNTAVMVEVNYHEPVPENTEEYGQRYGAIMSLPNLGDRLALQTGQLLITIGQKLMAAGKKHMRLSKDMA